MKHNWCVTHSEAATLFGTGLCTDTELDVVQHYSHGAVLEVRLVICIE